MTDQKLIDALVQRAQELALAVSGDASEMPAQCASDLCQTFARHRAEATELRQVVAHLAGLLDAPTPERRAAALAALDLPQEPS